MERVERGGCVVLGKVVWRGGKGGRGEKRGGERDVGGGTPPPPPGTSLESITARFAREGCHYQHCEHNGKTTGGGS